MKQTDKLIFSPKLIIDVYDKKTTFNLLATAEPNGKVRLWDFGGRLLSEFETIDENVIALQFSPMQKLQNTNREAWELVKYLIAVVEEEGEEGTVYRQVWNITEELDIEGLINRECE